jgi:gamma-glutamyltranspeptidase / glutathione hydrolase
MRLQQAVDTPRIHFQADPNVVDIEQHAMSLLTKIRLMLMGYSFKRQPGWGAVEAIQIDENGAVTGANDKRRPDGAAMTDQRPF